MHKDGLYKVDLKGGNDIYVTDKLKTVDTPEDILPLLDGASRFKGGVRLYEITTDNNSISMTWTKVNTMKATTARSFVRFGRRVGSVFGESEQSKKESISATINTIYGMDTKVNTSAYVNDQMPEGAQKKYIESLKTSLSGKTISDAYAILTKGRVYDYLPEIIKFSFDNIVFKIDGDDTYIPISKDKDFIVTFCQNIKTVYAPTPTAPPS
jgi:hypothetical protein